MNRFYFTFIFKIFLIFFIKINFVLAENLYEISADKVRYKDNLNIVIAEGNAKAWNQDKKEIYSDKIIYFKNKKFIETFGNSKYLDGKNKLTAENFKYNLDTKIVEAKENVVFEDNKNNILRFSFFRYFEVSEKGYGENLKGRLNDGSYIQSLKSNTNNLDNITVLNNADYTTCDKIKNNNDEYCPSWTLSSKKVTHDKSEKMIYHKHAVLKLKNVPVFYTPYFSHPDPTVKRKSGFMPPLIKTISNLGRTIRTPYYWVISEDKDLTLTPIYYADEKNMFLTSYRQAYDNGFLQIENGYTEGYERLNKPNRTGGSRNYIFANYKGTKNNLIFDENEIDFKIERISQQNFIRVNKITTDLFDQDTRNLENSIKISSYGGRKKLQFRAGIFENLDTEGSSKYTYYLPDASFAYNSRLKNAINLNLNSYVLGQKFSSNQKQFKFRNMLTADSNQFANKTTGIGTTFRASLYNKNLFNKNVNGEKEDENIDNHVTFALDNSFPLAKFKKNSYETITPRFFVKYTTGTMQDASSNSKILNFSDVFSMNRTNNLDKPETGMSFGHGVDYKSITKNYFENVNFEKSIGIGQVLRTYRMDNMPNTSSLNNKTSDFAGFVSLNFLSNKQEAEMDKNNLTSIGELKKNNNLRFNYDFNLSNDFSQFNRNSISSLINYEGLNTNLVYEEKNNHIGNEKSASIDIKKLINKDYYISLSGKRNLKNNTSEYHNFGLSFENDCLTASISLQRDFYYDRDVVNDKSLIFSIIIKPFGDDFAPDLSNLIN